MDGRKDCERLKAAADQYRGEADRAADREIKWIERIAELENEVWESHEGCDKPCSGYECCRPEGCWVIRNQRKKTWKLLPEACDVCKAVFDKKGGKM